MKFKLTLNTQCNVIYEKNFLHCLACVITRYKSFGLAYSFFIKFVMILMDFFFLFTKKSWRHYEQPFYKPSFLGLSPHSRFGLSFSPWGKILERWKNANEIKRPNSPERGFFYWISFAFVMNWKENENKNVCLFWKHLFHLKTLLGGRS